MLIKQIAGKEALHLMSTCVCLFATAYTAHMITKTADDTFNDRLAWLSTYYSTCSIVLPRIALIIALLLFKIRNMENGIGIQPYHGMRNFMIKYSILMLHHLAFETNVEWWDRL